MLDKGLVAGELEFPEPLLYIYKTSNSYEKSILTQGNGAQATNMWLALHFCSTFFPIARQKTLMSHGENCRTQYPRCRSPPASEIKRLPQISEEQEVCLMAEGNNYYIRVRGALVQVTSEVYKACHQTKRRAKTLYEKDERNGLVSYDSMDTEDTLGEEMIPDHSLPSVEDAALKNLLQEKLRYCLKQLPKADQDLLHALYFEELSERQFADKLGLHYMTVHSRKVKILANLKKMINS